MSELVRNAWLGWSQYRENGKVAALFLAALLFLCLKKRVGHRSLTAYSAVMAALCICPLTAAGLMLYQTKFYDYVWIWSLAPVTLLIAFAGTVFLSWIWESYGKRAMIKTSLLVVCVCVILFLCGSLGGQDGGQKASPESRREIAEVLESIAGKGAGQEEEICLWAPREVMACARSYSGEIRLPYGRNLWDNGLNAYAYDTYEEAAYEMDRWMCSLEEAAGESPQEQETLPRQKAEDTEACLQSAVAAGVNRILLPQNTDPEVLKQAEEVLGAAPEQIGGYYLFLLRK